jgi:hypothetical protein
MRVYLTIQICFIHILDFSCLKLYWIGKKKNFCKKVSIVMVNNFTIINKRTSHLPPQVIEK